MASFLGNPALFNYVNFDISEAVKAVKKSIEIADALIEELNKSEQ